MVKDEATAIVIIVKLANYILIISRTLCVRAPLDG